VSQQVYNCGKTSPKFKHKMKAVKAPYCQMYKNTQKARHSTDSSLSSRSVQSPSAMQSVT